MEWAWKSFHEALLTWYDNCRRDLPWRALPGVEPNPYHVLLSELMLQQTTVGTVIPYFHSFIRRWPTLSALAQASLEDVYLEWQGLGYYSRARHLHRCVQEIDTQHHGKIPQDLKTLRRLPGIGPYTAAAIASIAYGDSLVPVDGNVIRIFSRLFTLEEPLPALQKQVWDRAAEAAPSEHAGDFAQALMDLGSSLCRPKNPLCSQCPVWDFCEAGQAGRGHFYPKPKEKKQKPRLHGVVVWHTEKEIEKERERSTSPQEENRETQGTAGKGRDVDTSQPSRPHQTVSKGRVWIRQRPPQGLLAHLMEYPGSPWRDTPFTDNEITHLLQSPEWAAHPLPVRHSFTHFHLTLWVVHTSCPPAWDTGFFVPIETLDQFPFPTLMKKVRDRFLNPTLF